MKNFLLKWIRRTLGSLFFLGYIPGAPGTWGAGALVAALWFTRDTTSRFFGPDYYVASWVVILAVIALSVLCANDAKHSFGANDPKAFVLDEVAGQLITFFMIPFSWRVLVLGFLLFRFFDIVKPFPVYKFEEIEDGLGVVMDDVAAGVMANISLAALLWVYHGIKSLL
jgi:phosphatidylglycerophosphatase A